MARSFGGRDLEKPYGPSAVKLPHREFQVLMENAQVLPGKFMNFEGRPGLYNAEGQRNFCVLLDPEVAEDMLADGWNVKQFKEYEGEPGDYYIQVEAKYRDRYGNDLRPPKIQMITSKGPTRLGENDVWMLDKIDAARVDLIFNGRVREEDGERKIKAYLQTYFCHVNEDYLELKYADILDGPDVEAPQFTDAQSPRELEDPNVIEGEVVSDSSERG